jgi:hypothetical protein
VGIKLICVDVFLNVDHLLPIDVDEQVSTKS